MIGLGEVGDVVSVRRVHFSNDIGGTMMAGGPFKVVITKSWHDYETGWRFIGDLVDLVDVGRLERLAVTGFKESVDAKIAEAVAAGRTIPQPRAPALPAVFFGQFDY